MKKITNEESKLLLKTIITLSIIFFFISVADFFFSSKKMLLYPTSIVLLFNLVMLFNINKSNIERFKFLNMSILTIYFSFLCHYFFLDLFFVAIFCLLFLYTLVLFKNLQRIILCSLIIISITFLLFLFREQNNILRSSGDSNLYLGYLRVTAVLAIGLLFYYIADFWFKNKRAPEESLKIVQNENNTVVELVDIFESINRRDNSFMPLFLATNLIFVNKIREICPKINETELEVCALIKLGLTTKEIAIATNSTYKAIESIKYRLRKKMNLESSVNLMLFFNEM
ncbi:helix-turn-helix transcriptional regulator [Chryseobacterium sp. FH2]|uniref:helix-turn-helix transcriptional regulator n=1 Tax=Chryseobacterium sp. FH2 TaxID=1674291 RepID=UPI000AD2EBC8|nr:LuxR C-terminal-related transcriptional regulator [Chryseobacterium sp. FH2]